MPYLSDLMRDDLPREPGIYWFRHRPNGKFKPLSRARKIDPRGIIYIGTTKDLHDRLWKFRRVVFDDFSITEGHVAANRYVRSAALHDTFKPHDLWLEWEKVADADRAEKDELLKYMGEFAELPPLNFQAPFASLATEMGVPMQFPLPAGHRV